MLDTTAVGHLAAQLMDRLTEEYGEDAEIGTVAVVVEVEMGNATAITYRCTDARRWIQVGLFGAAQRAVLEQDDED